MKREELFFFTVGTKKQKSFCEKIIAEYKENYGIDILVVADEETGCRIGSGGAMLSILSRHFQKNRKIIIINSGGQSKRTPNYSAKNKALANLSLNNEPVTLLELIIKNTKALSDRFNSGVLVACSDILVNAEKINTEFDNNIGFCAYTDLKTGSRHGVMFPNSFDILAEYPHKADIKTLKQLCDVYRSEKVLADTGLLYFTEEFCTDILQCEKSSAIIEKLINHRTELDLYSDIVTLLSETIDKSQYLSSGSSVLCEIKSDLLKLHKAHSLKVYALNNHSFYHFGSLEEARSNIISLSESDCDIIKINSRVDKDCFVGKGTVLDNVILKSISNIGSDCFISDIFFSGSITIEDQKAVFGIKLNDGSFVTILLDINENPKDLVGSEELWDTKRFYKAKSFDESLNKFYNKANEEPFSLSYCIDNADLDYYSSHSKYIEDLNLSKINENYLMMRKKILDNHFSHTPLLKSVTCKKNKIEINLPLRVNLSGTWTDAMPYCIDNGGQVVNMAVTVDNKKPVKVIVEKLQRPEIEFCSDGTTVKFDISELDSECDLSDFNLHISALKTLGINCNTAISDGFRLTTEVRDIDKGSGLGTSSILLGGCLAALSEMFGLDFDSGKILKMVFVAEQIMGTGGGWQDQFGGLTPSIKTGTTVPGIEQELVIEQIEISDSFKNLFETRLILVPTGQRHFGRFIVNDVADRYLSKNPESLKGHKDIRALNAVLKKSLKEGNTELFFNSVNKHFELLKAISPLVSNKKIDELTQFCLDNFAHAVSICGAGGGGYLLAVLKEGESSASAQALLNEHYPWITSPIKTIQILNDLNQDAFI